MIALQSIAKRPTWWIWLLAAVSLLMIAAMVSYPLGYDQAVFEVGGRMVLRGSIPWRDFIDTKPPLIFYLYAGAHVLFGGGVWSIRLFDALYQIEGGCYFFIIARRHLSDNIALLSASLMLIMYAGLGFWHTAQAESFALIPSLLLADMTLRATAITAKRSIAYGMAAGFATILLLLLKPTLILGTVAAVVWLAGVTTVSRSNKRKFLIALGIGFLFLFMLLLVGLALTSSLDRSVEVIAWLRHYSRLGQPIGLPWRHWLLDFPLWLVWSASPTLFLLGVGTIWYVRKGTTEKEHAFLRLLLLSGLLQLFGIVLEGKMFVYQYARALWAFAPFAAIGLHVAVTKSNEIWRRKPTPVRTLVVTGIVLLAILGSPLAKVVSQSIPWTLQALKHVDSGPEVHRRIVDYFADEEERAGRYLKSRMGSSDQMFFWGNDVGIYLSANTLPPTLCLTATPFRAATPLSWKTAMLGQLQSADPKFFVVEYGDAKDYITGSKLDSYAALLEWPQLRDYLAINYRRDTVIGHYLIYSRIAVRTILSHKSSKEMPAAWAASGSRLVEVMPGSVLISKQE